MDKSLILGTEGWSEIVPGIRANAPCCYNRNLKAFFFFFWDSSNTKNSINVSYVLHALHVLT